MERVICLVIGYVCGCFQTGYIYGKYMEHLDIRTKGSGNAGATNTLRVLGIKAGLFVFLGDFFKTLIPCLLVRYFWNSGIDTSVLLMGYIGLGTILGHNFPFYLDFKGGKGVASTAGFIVALDLRIMIVCFTVFILIVVFTKYVSLASITIMIILFVMSTIFSRNGDYMLSAGLFNEFNILTFFICSLSVYRHKANIKRLLKNTENKFTTKR